MGTILYSLGLLASNEVNVISATELVGEYTGQTGPKVRRQFEASLGKVLFIDEAYRLDNGGGFGKELVPWSHYLFPLFGRFRAALLLHAPKT